MSHAVGEVYRERTLIGYFDYNGTTDVARPKVFASLDELEAEWRQSQGSLVCCGHSAFLEVVLYADYGSGFYWTASYCEVCRRLTRTLNPWDGPCLGRCEQSKAVIVKDCGCYPLIMHGHPLNDPNL